VALADRTGPKRADPLYDRVLLSAIYSVRSDYVRRVASGLGGAQASQLLQIVRDRYPEEYQRAQEMLA